MKSFLKISLAVFLNFTLFINALLADLPPISFETAEWIPWQPVGQNPASGWQIHSGNAVVSPSGTGYGGGQALKLPVNASQEAQLSRDVTWDPAQTTAFIDLQIKPAADPDGSLASFYANGTQIAFQVPQGSTTGEVWVYHGNDGLVDPSMQPEQWVRTAGSYQVPQGSTSSANFVRVTLRHDYSRNLWDLFIDGKLAAANLAFEGRGGNLQTLDFYGSRIGDTFIDDLAAMPDNMLFADADKDGLSDAWEIANGSNPNLYDRDSIKPGTALSFLDHYLASLWSSGGVNVKAGVPVYGGIPPLTILGSHQPVGALKGSLSVAGDGSSSYSVPIDLPKGTAGMEPKLSLAYSSGGGNGIAGLGWNLTGLQRVTRGPSSAAKDGSFDPMDFDDSDRFFLDGERLVCVDGTYGAAGSKYRTEIDSFARITAIGAGPASWKVETKAGLIVFLGETADSRTAVTAGTLSWGVNRVEDTVGNFYTVDYTRDSTGGQPFDFIDHRVSAVNYTGNAGMAPYCHVYFDYEARPDTSRAYTTHAGYRVAKRLSRIRVMTGTFTNHSYRLAYTNSYQTGRSLLTSIAKHALDSNTLAIPPTEFNYDGIAEGEDIWLDPGDTNLPTYSSGLDATEAVNSMVTVEDDDHTIRLSGDVSRAYLLPGGGVTLYSDSMIQFQFKSDTLYSGGIIGLDNDKIYQSSSASTPSKLFRIGGTGGIRMAPDVSGYTPVFVGPTQAYSEGEGWKTFNLNIGQFGTGLRQYLILMCADGSTTNGIEEAIFRNIRIYRSGSQIPGNVAPIQFDIDTQLPRYSTGEGKDLGIVAADLNSDGLPDLADWRVTSYTVNTNSDLLPETGGNIYRNTGNGFVLDHSIRPPSSMPLSVRDAHETAHIYNLKHNLLARPMDIDGDGSIDLLASTDIKRTSQKLKNGYRFYCFSGTSWIPKAGWDLPFRIENTASSEENGGKRRCFHFEWVDLNSDGYQDLSIYTSIHGQLYDIATNALVIDTSSSTVYLNKGKNGPGWIRDDSYRLPQRLMDMDPGPEDEGRRLMDLDGDGKVEIAEAAYIDPSFTKHTYRMTDTGAYRWNSTPGQNVTFPPADPYDLPLGLVVDFNGKDAANILLDCNGDGLTDILRWVNGDFYYPKATWLNRGGRTASPWNLETVAGSTAGEKDSYVLPRPLHNKEDTIRIPYGFEFADLNGDGLVDILSSNEELSYTAGTDNLAILNTGNGWLQREAWKTSGYRITGSNGDRIAGKRHAKLQDLNGDGFPDLVTHLTAGTPKVWYNRCRPEVLTSVVDGFGSALAVEYHRLNDPSPTTGFGARVYEKFTGTLPAGHSTIIDARYVVSRYSEPDGMNGRRYRSQRYGDLRYDRFNESSLGFGWVEALDETTGQTTRTETRRDYPFGGSPVYSGTRVNLTAGDIANMPQSATAGVPLTPGMKMLSSETSAYAEMPTQIGVGGTIRRPVQISSVKNLFDLDLTLKVQTVTTQALADFDAYGFVEKSTVVSLDGSTVVTDSDYTHHTDHRWHLGRLGQSTVVKSGGGKPTITKSSSFTYDSVTGMLKSETIEPGNSLSVTKSYTHDGFGNVTATSVTASGQTRTGTSGYDSKGRFALWEKNQINHQVSYAYDSDRALLASTTDINSKTTYFAYDDFGTLIRTDHPDGTQTGEITGFASNASLPSNVVSQTSNPICYFRAKQTSGSPVAKVYLDAMGRELVTETTILRDAAASGSSRYSQAYATVRYDYRGRKIQFSEAFGAGEAPRFTTIRYDLLNRVIQTTHPDTTSDQVIMHGAVVTAQPYTYSKVANRNGQMLERWEDQHGRLIQSKDNSGQTTAFNHDHEGRLVDVKINAATLLTNTWDVLGNKTSVTEVNSGTSSSIYNGFGEVLSSTNARSQTTTFTYDVLGRPLTVVKPEGTYTSTHDGASGASLGMPWKTTGPNGYVEEAYYDALGRSTGGKKTQFGETFTTATTYNALGQPLTARDAGGLTVVHGYDSTYSFPVSLAIGPGSEGAGTILWKAGTFDSKGRALAQTLAQGVATSATYETDSGLLETLAANHPATGPLQDKECDWSPIGNLTDRFDYLAGLKETFTYDGQNRLTGATTAHIGSATTTLPPPQSYSYADNGNLLTKGTTTITSYDSTRIHAVTGATIKGQARTYAYNAAGYVTADTKRAYTWTSFGQLATLHYPAAPALEDFQGLPIHGVASVSTTFDFDAGGNRAFQRKERTATNDSRVIEETLYLGSYEREIHQTKANSSATPVLGKTVHRHSLGGAVYTRTVNPNTGTSIKLTTVLKDHLGTTDVLLTGTWNGGSFANPSAEYQAFDPWGERRKAETWENFRVNDGDAFHRSAQDHDRGYTGHEQLDDSGLIHMNGRIYDPELGRFLSPDPVVQIPEYSQNFNRYSYVLNNPINATDPSGFSWLSNQFHKLGKWLGEDWSQVLVFVVQIVVSAVSGPMGPQIGAATAAGLATALNGGGTGDVHKAMALAFAVSSITQGFDQYAASATSSTVANGAIQTAGHAVIGGTANVVMGGKFQDGFYSAAVANELRGLSGVASYYGIGRDYISAGITQAVIGGTASAVGGGKFANGAASSAFFYLGTTSFASYQQSRRTVKIYVSESADELFRMARRNEWSAEHRKQIEDYYSGLGLKGINQAIDNLKNALYIDNSASKILSPAEYERFQANNYQSLQAAQMALARLDPNYKFAPDVVVAASGGFSVGGPALAFGRAMGTRESRNFISTGYGTPGPSVALSFSLGTVPSAGSVTNSFSLVSPIGIGGGWENGGWSLIFGNPSVKANWAGGKNVYLNE